MRAKVLLFVAPLFGLLCFTADGRAGMITWTADWSQSTNAVPANGGLETGGVALASPPTSTIFTGNTTVTAATLTTFGDATQSNPDLFLAAPYTLKVKLTDLASNLTGTLIFTGSFSGSLTQTTAAFTNTFNSPITQSVQIGANDYTVTMTSFMAPGAPIPVGGGDPVQGFIKAQINVQSVVPPGGGSTNPLSTPEPTSLVLAGLGSMFGLFRWRRTRLPAAV
jgi:hypothetical protein